jgi:hypothetical protein
MPTPATDRTTLDPLLARAVGDLSAGRGGVTVRLGYKRGPYRAMAGDGAPRTRRAATPPAGAPLGPRRREGRGPGSRHT